MVSCIQVLHYIYVIRDHLADVKCFLEIVKQVLLSKDEIDYPNSIPN